MRSLPFDRLQFFTYLLTASILAISLIALPQISWGQAARSNLPITVLGQSRQTPYIVVIPTSDRQVLILVQRYIPTAFMTNSRLGSYIHAGAYADRASAEYLTDQLRQRGLDARVVYLPL